MTSSILKPPLTRNRLAARNTPGRKRSLPRRKDTADRAGDSLHTVSRGRRPGVVALVFFAAGMIGLVLVIAWWIPANRRRHAPTHGCTVLNRYPHDPAAFCQGLEFDQGFLYEGTGSFGQSSIRKVDLETGRVVQRHDLDKHLFGEGITIWKNSIIQLTWKTRQAIVYDLASFREQNRFRYRGEGWGLTHDTEHLIMSDGTDTLRFLDPATFAVVRRLVVRDGNRRIRYLNELEYVEGVIFANIWYKDQIVKISPRTGRVVGWIDLSRLLPASKRRDADAVLNGIAYDSRGHRLFVTGKNWPTLFEIRENP